MLWRTGQGVYNTAGGKVQVQRTFMCSEGKVQVQRIFMCSGGKVQVQRIFLRSEENVLRMTGQGTQNIPRPCGLGTELHSHMTLSIWTNLYQCK